MDHEVLETNVERVVRRNLENLPSISYTTCFLFGAGLKNACYRREGVLSPSYTHNSPAQSGPVPQRSLPCTKWKEYINVQIDGFIFFGNVSCVEVEL